MLLLLGYKALFYRDKLIKGAEQDQFTSQSCTYVEFLSKTNIVTYLYKDEYLSGPKQDERS